MGDPLGSGERRGWELLEERAVQDIAAAAGAAADPAASVLIVRSFGQDISISLKDRAISGRTPEGSRLLSRLGGIYRLSLLWYLATAKDLSCSGRLVRPRDLPGGDIFGKGSHVMPLDRIAAAYGTSRETFLARGTSLNGSPVKLADAGLLLRPVPRIPVTLGLWLADDEFPARADIFLDSTCSLQAPTDVLWGICLMTVEALL